MNHEKVGIMEGKGEFIAKLGQVRDQRAWALRLSLEKFAVPSSKMSYWGEGSFACKT